LRGITLPYHCPHYARPVIIHGSRFILFLLLILTSVLRTHSQVNTPVEYIGIEQGLSNNAVTCIYQDRYGFMWFGTYDGLNRYDGYHFKVFRNKPDDSTSLLNNRIVAICEDQQNNLWIGTKRGVSVFNSITCGFSPVTYQPYKAPGIEKLDLPINDIKTDVQGNILIGTGGRGLLSCTKGSKQAIQVPYVEDTQVLLRYHVQAIKIDKLQRAWLFVQGKGLCLYDDRTGQVKPVNQAIRSGYCLEADNNGTIWIGSENGLTAYHIASNTLKHYDESSGALTNNKVVGLCLDKKNKLWIATDGGGIDILDIQTGKVSYLAPEQNKKSLTSTSIYAVYEDKELRKWIGTLRGGINVIDPHKNRFTTIAHDPFSRNSLIDNFVLSFCEDFAGNLWIGTDGSGLSYWNRKQNSYIHFKHELGNTRSLSNNFVTSIVRDYRDNIWIATYGGGINRYNKTNGTFEHYSCNYPGYTYGDKNVWKLFEDSKKNLWAGAVSPGRLYKLNPLTNQFESFDDKVVDVLTLAEDKDGVLWAGTFSDLIQIDVQNKKHRFFKTGNAVRSIYEDKAGNFWVGTEGNGLQLFDRKNGTFAHYTESHGLCSNSVLNTLEDNHGNLWISTFNGISRFDPQHKTFKNFYVSDGLQSNQFNYNAAIQLHSGEFAFGGIKGFNLFYPDSIANNAQMPNLLLTGLKIDNVAVEQDSTFANGQSLADIDQLRIPYSKAVIAIDFAALEYSAPDKISYAYYMEGWDKGWNYVGRVRTANYSRLTEGDYTFRIKSTNAEGIWNNKERIIYITVLPPWFRSWWAYLLYTALAAAAIWLYLLYKNRQARLKYEIQIAHINAEKEKELNEKKLSFFTNISHEFRTPLTLIINPIKELLYSKEQLVDTGELNIVYRNARRLLSLVDQLLLFRKADSEADKLRVVKMNFCDLCKEVYLCFVQQARSKKIQYEFQCTNPAIELYADREKMEITLFNLISNALKFTPEQGLVIVAVVEQDNHVEVSIADNGVGIPGSIGHKLFERFYQVQDKGTSLKTGFGIGLYLVKSFVESHHGRIDYTSKPGEGTRFVMTLLKGSDHFPADCIHKETMNSSVLLEELIEETTPEPVVDLLPVEPGDDPGSLVTDLPTMLIIDDNNQIRQYVAQIFRKTFHLYEADNGEDGLKLAKQYQPDIIISDVVMQGLTGIELCSSIKEDPSLNHIPLILLTASSSSDIKLKGVECGADDYITKPFEKELLVARVSSILKSRNNLQKYFYNEITLRQNTLKISAEYKEFLERCIAIVEQHLDNESFSIKTLASEIGMSHSNLYKKVKSISGQSVNSFIRFIRLRKAAELFINTPCNVNEAAFQVGMSDIKYFREQFNKLFGMNPSEYIKKYRKPFQKNFQMNK
jgi:signal transduction histidine kinase/ligand-binding sensor domain-containing protein/DNA-binding response OmpR family regulator